MEIFDLVRDLVHAVWNWLHARPYVTGLVLLAGGIVVVALLLSPSRNEEDR